MPIAAVLALVAALQIQGPSKHTAASDTGARPGLITTAGDKTGARVVSIESTVGGTWPNGQSPHPTIPSDQFSVKWAGELRIPRAGKYRITAIVRGRVKLTIGGKVMIGAEAADAHPGSGAEAVALETEWAAFEAGETPFLCEFEKHAPDARMQLLWESEDFGRVPVPAAALVHKDSDEPAELAAGVAWERGKLVFETQRCVACHARSDANAPLPGPDLTRIGARVSKSWIFEYLHDPSQHRSGFEMPGFFGDDDEGIAGRQTIALYLSNLKGDGKVKKDERKPDLENGKKAFAFRGCVACHNSPEAANTPESIPRSPMFSLGSKYLSIVALADFIQKPLETHRAGTMPELRIPREECIDIAAFLMTARDPAFERDVQKSATASEEQSIALGSKEVAKRGCLACHVVGKDTNTAPAAPSLERGLPNNDKLGCARGVAPHGGAPAYNLSDSDCDDLKTFLALAAKPAKSESLAYESRRAILRMGCLQCHTRDGAGGGLAELQKVALGEKLESEIEQVGPPDLSGIGSKVRPEWLREMFTSTTRARPWIQVKMPQFGRAVELLGLGFAAMDGEELESPIRPRADDFKTGVIGQDLIGKKGFNCIACHDLAGWEASVAFVDARGPDLTLTPRRVRESWFRRWCLDPQALSPGTKMPTFFPGGKSTLAGRHGLDTEGQLAALYDYLALGEKAPLPAGLANNNGWSWLVEGRPAILRTPFDGSPRTICVGFPGGVSIAYDAEHGRLIEVWQGGFLRMNGTQWTGQHGPYPTPEGKIVWKAKGDAPAWVAGAVAKGEYLPAAGPARYLGYTEKNGNYTFKFSIPSGAGTEVIVEERFVGAVVNGAVQLDRHVTLRNVAKGRFVALKLASGEKVHFKQDLPGGGLVEETVGAGDGPGVNVHVTDGLIAFFAFQSAKPGLDGTFMFVTNENEGKQLDACISVIQGADSAIPNPLPENFKDVATTDAFGAAPLVGASYDGRPVEGEHPFALEEKSYRIESLPVPEETVLQGGGADFLPNGSLAVSTRRGEVWILENATKTPDQFKWRRFAHGLHEPLGLKVVDGTIYVLQKPEITKLLDTDGDGTADEYICYNAGWQLSTNFHEFAFGLEYYKGSFYGTLGLAIIPGGATRPEQVFARGSAWRVDHDQQFEVLGLGARTPNGTGIGANGEFYYTDNQGDYIPACKLIEVHKGEFYGQRFALKDRNAEMTVTPPVCWFPYGAVSQSSTNVILENRGGRFGPFAGQLLVGELTNSQILRVQLESVKGKNQGTVWIFRRGFGSGVERLVWGPDDQIYVTQTTGGWGARGGKLFALERVGFTGKTPFEMKTVHLLKDGFEIEFTKPIAPGPATPAAENQNSASVEQFHYHYWATYGSPEIDRKACKVSEFALSADRTKITFKVAEMLKDRICEIRLRNITSDDGEALAHAEAYYTLNEFPD